MSGADIGKLEVDGNNLYREETFTDMKTASFRMLIPVREDGSPDEQREVSIMGLTHVASEAGPVPVQCHLESKTLKEAVAEFPDAARRALDQMIEEARKMKEQRAKQESAGGTSSGGIVLP